MEVEEGKRKAEEESESWKNSKADEGFEMGSVLGSRSGRI
jgi:hypothetical protein